MHSTGILMAVFVVLTRVEIINDIEMWSRMYFKASNFNAYDGILGEFLLRQTKFITVQCQRITNLFTLEKRNSTCL